MLKKIYYIVDDDYQRARELRSLLQPHLPEVTFELTDRAEQAPEGELVFAADTLASDLSRPTMVVLRPDSQVPMAGDGEWLPESANATLLRIGMERAQARGQRRLWGNLSPKTSTSDQDRHGTLTTVTRTIMHEFNNHHAVILSSLERLTLQGQLNEKQRETIGRGIEAVDRATEWIRRLRRNLPPHSVQLAQFNPLEFLKRYSQHQHQALQQALPLDDIRQRISCDPRDLTSILDNILQALAIQGAEVNQIAFEASEENRQFALVLTCPGAHLAKSNDQPTIDLLIPEILAGRNRGEINYRPEEIVIRLPLA
jgi:hypothetical protein